MINENKAQWWKDPRGIGAMIAIAALIIVQPAVFGFGLFYSREKKLWDITTRITAIEQTMDERVLASQANERAISAVRDRIAENERRLEINAQRILRMEGIIDRHFPQGNKLP